MHGGTTRIMVVQDRTFAREALVLALTREPDLAVVGEAGSLAEARASLGRVDVALVELGLPTGDGATLIEELCAVNPGARALVLTTGASRKEIACAIEAGAAGVIDRSVPLAALIEAVRGSGTGRPLVPPGELVELLRLAGRERRREEAARRTLAQLTPREREVLAWLGEGLSDAEIARRLYVSTDTVQSHMLNLLRKLGVSSRLQALIFAVRHGVIRIE